LPVQGFINTDNLSRIEVFRGANAIIAGTSATNRSGPGGAFNLVPKRPDEEPITEVTVGYDKLLNSMITSLAQCQGNRAM
jgi:outer membrane receptor protein involved in Fe transport